MEGKRGRLLVNDYMQSPDYPNVYVVGDVAWYVEGKRVLPQIVETAVQTGATAAHNIAAEINGGEMKRFRSAYHGIMVSLGTYSGVAHVMGMSLTGIFAMAVKHMINVVHLFTVAGVNQVWEYVKHEFLDVRDSRSFIGGFASHKVRGYWLLLLRLWLGFMWVVESTNKITEGWLDFSSGKSQTGWMFSPGVIQAGVKARRSPRHRQQRPRPPPRMPPAPPPRRSVRLPRRRPLPRMPPAPPPRLSVRLPRRRPLPQMPPAPPPRRSVPLPRRRLPRPTQLPQPPLPLRPGLPLLLRPGLPLLLRPGLPLPLRPGLPPPRPPMAPGSTTTRTSSIPIGESWSGSGTWFMDGIFSHIPYTWFQLIIVFTEMLIGLALFGGLFTWWAAVVSLGLCVIFTLSGMFAWNQLWFFFAAILMLGGAGRAFGLDSWVVPFFKNWWNATRLARRTRLYADEPTTVDDPLLGRPAGALPRARGGEAVHPASRRQPTMPR